MADYPEALARVLETLAPLAAAKGRATVAESSDLVGELGLSSIDVMEVIERIEDEFDLSFPLNNLPNIRTAGDLAREIARLGDA
jgi:acyl carrier protein